MDFDKALAHTLTFEGGYANDPADSGGETFRGISRRNWPEWSGWKKIDQVKARGATTAKLIDVAFQSDMEMTQMVAAFYYLNFWKPFNSLEASDRIVAKVFDTAVNVGVSGATKMLQRAINKLGPVSQLTVDGKIGPRTRSAFDIVIVVKDGEARFLRAFCAEQESHYRAIVQRKPSQAKFLKGWLRRAEWVPA